MVRVSNIILPPEGDFLLLKKKAARILGVPMGKIHRCVPVRQSTAKIGRASCRERV